MDNLYLYSYFMYIKSLVKQRTGEVNQSLSISTQAYKTLIKMISSKEEVPIRYYSVLFNLLLIASENYHHKLMFNDSIKYCKIVQNVFEENQGLLARNEEVVKLYKKSKFYSESDQTTLKTDFIIDAESDMALKKEKGHRQPQIDPFKPQSNSKPEFTLRMNTADSRALSSSKDHQNNNNDAPHEKGSISRGVSTFRIVHRAPSRSDQHNRVAPVSTSASHDKQSMKSRGGHSIKVLEKDLYSGAISDNQKAIWQKIMKLRFLKNPYFEANRKQIKHQYPVQTSGEVKRYKNFISEKRFDPYKPVYVSSPPKRDQGISELDRLVEMRKRAHSKGFTQVGPHEKAVPPTGQHL